MPPDKSSAECIRQAVASGEFRKALALWEDHARQLREEIRSGRSSSAKLAEARDLVEWCRITALCAKGHAQAQLNRIGVAARYETQRVAPASRLSARF